MPARHDRAAVDDQAGDVEARQRHRRGRDGLVAADQHDHAVEAVAAGDQFDRVGDRLARHQRALHALRAHRDAVGDDDGAEFERRAAGFADAGLEVFAEFAQVDVARRHVGPGVDHRDHRLGDFPLAEAGGPKHGAGRRPFRSFLDLVATHPLCRSAVHIRSKKNPQGLLRVSPGISFPKLTRTRPRSEKKRKESARKKQAEGQVQRARRAAAGSPVNGNGCWLAARVHSAMTPQPPNHVKRFFRLARRGVCGPDRRPGVHAEGETTGAQFPGAT